MHAVRLSNGGAAGQGKGQNSFGRLFKPSTAAHMTKTITVTRQRAGLEKLKILVMSLDAEF